MLITFALISMVALRQGNHEASYFDLKEQKTKLYAVPKFAQVKKVNFHPKSIEAEFVSSLPKNPDGRLTFELYFQDKKSGKAKGLILPLANYVFPSKPTIGPEQCAVVDVITGKVLERVRVARRGTSISFNPGEKFLRANSATMGLMRYAPLSLDNKTVHFGSDCIAQIFFPSQGPGR